MEDLQSILQSVLSDPAQMAQVASLAQSLGLGSPPNGESPASDGTQASSPAPDLGALTQLAGAAAALQGAEDEVFRALRPSLSQKGQAKLDRASRAAKLSRLLGRCLRGKDGDGNV